MISDDEGNESTEIFRPQTSEYCESDDDISE